MQLRRLRAFAFVLAGFSSGAQAIPNMFPDEYEDPMPAGGASSAAFDRTLPNEGLVGARGTMAFGRSVGLPSGNTIETERDFATSGLNPLALVRTYNKDTQRPGLFGYFWLTLFDQKLIFEYTGTTVSKIRLLRRDGAEYAYTWDAAAARWTNGEPNSLAYLNAQADGSWIHFTDDHGQEVYSATGLLTRLVDAYGQALDLTYSNGLLQSVTSAAGRSIGFTRVNGRVTAVTDPAGNVFSYSYNTAGYLTGVTYPATLGSRTYVYGDSRFPGALTGININGTRYRTFTYQADGRVASAEHAGGINKETYVYGTDRVTITNALGAQKVKVYAVVSGHARLVRETLSGVTGATTMVTEKFYDPNGYLDREVFPNGNTIEYSYSANGELLEQITGIDAAHPTGDRRVVNTWDTPNNRIIKVQLYGNGSLTNLVSETTFIYFTSGQQANRLASVENCNKSAVGLFNQCVTTSHNYTFHANGLAATHTADGPLPGTIDQVVETFDSAGNLTTLTNALGHTTSYSGYNNLGLPGSMTGPNGGTSSFSHDALGRTTSVTRVVNGSNQTTSFELGPFGVTKTTFPDGEVENRTYLASGLLSSIYRHVVSANEPDAQSFSYNALGSVTSYKITQLQYVPMECEENWKGIMECTPAHYETLVYFSRLTDFDQIGRVKAERWNDGLNVRYRYTYDSNGNLKTITDGLNQVTTLEYNAHNEKTRATDALNQITQYSHDAAGRLVSVTDPKNNTTNYQFDGLGNLISLSSPDTGTSWYEYADGVRQSSLTRADGSVTTYSYNDPLGRISGIVAGSASQSFAYDTCLNGSGKLCSVADGSNSIAYTYLPSGETASETSTIEGVSYEVGRAYDGRGRLKTLTYPGGDQAIYNYDGFNRLSSVQAKVGATTTTVATFTSYLPYGPARTTMLGNGLSRLKSFDLDYRQQSITTTDVQSLWPLYNANNQIFKISNYSNTALTQIFGYDAANRLNSVTATAGNQSWTFDANGNRTSHTWGGAVDTYSPESFSNKIASIAGSRAKAFTFDDLGNMTSKTGYGGDQTYVPGPFNRLQSVTTGLGTTNYKYNVLNQRVRKAGPGGTRDFLYSQKGSLLGETSGGSTLTTKYVWANGEPIAIIRNGALFYVHNDQLGRPEVVTNSAKTIVWRASNFAFDRTVTTDNFGGLNLGFPGQYHDAESGLYYNLNRYYDPQTGRYVSADPIGLKGGLSAYSYALNSPISLTDPTGLKTQSPCTTMDFCTIVWVNPDSSWSAPNDDDTGFGIQNGSGPTLEEQIAAALSQALSQSGGASYAQRATYITIDANIAAASSMSFVDWVSSVRPGGAWDYKSGDYSCLFGCDNFGNFNYGATGAAQGIGLDVLLRSGGVVSELCGAIGCGTYDPSTGHAWGDYPYGDNWDDAPWIESGYDYYFNHQDNDETTP